MDGKASQLEIARILGAFGESPRYFLQRSGKEKIRQKEYTVWKKDPQKFEEYKILLSKHIHSTMIAQQ